MIVLAQGHPDQTVAVKTIAEKQGISAKYLEHLIGALKNSGLVRAKRGLNGGYTLARSPAEISLYDIYTALEGAPNLVDCAEHPENCPLNESCPTHDVWVRLGNAISEILSATTLQDMLDDLNNRQCVDMYNI